MSEQDFTKDDFLGGLISLKQPEKGYRITSDTVLLAATLKTKPGESIIDIGAGSGGILSCFAARAGKAADDITMSGVDIQADLLMLARENNKSITYIQGDILNEISGCEPNSFHHVVTNPPYYEKGKISKSPYKSKAIAHGNDMDDLTIWIERCLRMVRPKGYLSLVHRADRLDDILCALKPKAGSIIVYPLYSKAGNDANRVIIRAQKGGKGLLSLKSGLIMHKSDGKYTEAAENILRHAQFLDIEQ